MLLRLLREVVARLRAKGQAGEGGGVAHESAMVEARALYERGDLPASQAVYEEILRRWPDSAEAQCRLGIIHGRSGRYPEAKTLLLKAYARMPQHADALNALGNIARNEERWDEAEAWYRRALDIVPGDCTVWTNLSECLRGGGRIDAAEDALTRALELVADHPPALLNLAEIAFNAGRRGDARTLLKRCLTVDPGIAEAHTWLAHLMLQNREFAEGWREYEWRFRCAGADQAPHQRFPAWGGAPIAERTLLVRAEQGIGDQIMMASCLPDAIARTGLCMVECEPRLVALFARSFPRSAFFAHIPGREPRWANFTAAPDCEIPLGSLPGLFRKSEEDFPRHTGYLHADPARVAYWRARLDECGPGPAIGLSWRGGTAQTRRSLRSLALDQLLPLLQTEGAKFVSLQYGNCAQEIAALEKMHGRKLAHWQSAIDDYDETAALVSALDLVISVQTAVLHLAGALGKKTWAMIPSVPEWRYMASGETLPWYPGVRLFRQMRAGDWDPVLAKLTAELQVFVQSHPNAR